MQARHLDSPHVGGQIELELGRDFPLLADEVVERHGSSKLGLEAGGGIGPEQLSGGFDFGLSEVQGDPTPYEGAREQASARHLGDQLYLFRLLALEGPETHVGEVASDGRRKRERSLFESFSDYFGRPGLGGGFDTQRDPLSTNRHGLSAHSPA
jgi:hypothetical protein